jgi:hypothetical protein
MVLRNSASGDPGTPERASTLAGFVLRAAVSGMPQRFETYFSTTEHKDDVLGTMLYRFSGGSEMRS